MSRIKGQVSYHFLHAIALNCLQFPQSFSLGPPPPPSPVSGPPSPFSPCCVRPFPGSTGPAICQHRAFTEFLPWALLNFNPFLPFKAPSLERDRRDGEGGRGGVHHRNGGGLYHFLSSPWERERERERALHRFLSLTPRYPSSLDAGSLPVMADVPETPTGAHNLLRHGRQ